jgi:hypothetical protein
MKQHTMKLATLSMAAIALFVGILAIGFTPAQATMTVPSLKTYTGSSIPVSPRTGPLYSPCCIAQNPLDIIVRRNISRLSNQFGP